MVAPTGVLWLSVVVVCGGVLVLGSDVNWGKKVSCFVVDGSVVCPGCNYRAGLSCPRSLKNSQNCLEPKTPPVSRHPTTSTETQYEEINATETTLLASNTTLDSNEFLKAPTKSSVDMAIFLYRILGSRFPNRRYSREVQQEEEKEEAEICNWNGDCPCPLICCKTGPGCPKRCVMGIRLPPPWG